MNTSDIYNTATVFAIPLHDRFRGITVREGILFRGPAGWAEFAPFRDYNDVDAVPWLRAALDTAQRNWPAAVRSEIEVNTTVAVVSPERAGELVRRSGCRTAKVKVADPRVGVEADADRLAAVREALGPTGRIRIDANAAWTVAEAIDAITRLHRAAGGLEYVEQPCRTIAELAEVRRRVAVPIAADESIRRETDPLAVARAGAADIAVVKVAPLGGVHRALEIAVESGLPVVVSSAVDTAVGLAAGLALAGALPELPFACGLGTASLLTGDVCSQSLVPVAGMLPVLPHSPTPDRIEEFAADAETVDFWLARLQRVAALL